MRRVSATSGIKKIRLKAPWEIELLRRANAIVMEVLLRLAEESKPGVSTWDLEVLADTLCRKRGGRPAFKGYRGYPYALCVSVNEEVIHGMPREEKVLREGDIVSYDFGVEYEGYIGDAALTVAVGKVSDLAERLMKVTEEALYLGIDRARVGNRVGDISAAIQRHVEGAGFSVIRDFVGHGVGRDLHEPPEVPNFGKPGKGPRLQAGMVLAIEPMVVTGSPKIKILEDKWTAVTEDGGLAAHFEHSVAITARGPEILSRV